NAGESVTFNLTGVSDPSAADRAVLRYSFATTAGGLAADYASAGAANAFTTSFAAAGAYTIYARVYDKDGGIGTTLTLSVTIAGGGSQVFLTAGGDLIVSTAGATTNETIQIGSSGSSVTVTINGVSFGAFDPA